MKVSLNWLSDFVAIPWKAQELADRLTMAGLEIESIVEQGRGMESVVVAQIQKSSPHPNADRLSVCEVSTGSRTHQIVCGAKNYKVGDRVPLALPGAKLPSGMEIRAAKLRGVSSEGMLCSEKELGIAEDAEGLLILPAGLALGEPIAKALGLDDTIIDIEITPNRPDLLSHLGIAREIATLAGLPLKTPQVYQGRPGGKELFPVEIEAPDLCPRYSARLLRNIKVAPSPDWLQRRLRAVGQRPINNVVDTTNYVMLELGQPLHAFDTRYLDGKRIVVRRARAGEKITTLDEAELELDAETLVIADGGKAVALAGVMGGLHSGIQDDTVEVLIESASFKPSNVRRTSKKFQLRSESSYRFERGVDPLTAAVASDLATKLLVELAGAEVVGPLHMVEPEPFKARTVTVRSESVHRMAGQALPEKEIEKVFDGLGFQVNQRTAPGGGGPVESWRLQVPSYRLDVIEEVDVLEEIIRIYGIENLPAQGVGARWIRLEEPGRYFEQQQARELARDLGFDEISNYTLISAQQAHGIHGEAFPQDQILANPLTSEMDALRADLFLGMLDTISRNQAKRNLTLELFEIGRVFEGQTEATHLSLALSGPVPTAGWEGEPRAYDFFDLKGRVARILKEFGADARWQQAEHRGFALFIQLWRGNEEIGFIGQVAAGLLRSKKIEGDVCFAELDLDALIGVKPAESRFQPLPLYPAIQRDLALIVPDEKTYGEVEAALREIAGAAARSKNICLEQVRLFDIFRSEQVGAERKSMAFRFVYRSLEKTLTDSEVNVLHQEVVKKVAERLQCEVRV